jgi:hypothetical protein
MVGLVYTSLLLSVAVFALVRGDWEERLVACVMVAGSMATWAAYAYGGRDFINLHLPVLLIDSTATAIFLAVAYRSDRFWPLPLAAFQCLAFMALLTPWFSENLVSHALGVAQGIWAYPQLAILTMATIRGRNRAKRAAMRPSPA